MIRWDPLGTASSPVLCGSVQQLLGIHLMIFATLLSSAKAAGFFFIGTQVDTEGKHIGTGTLGGWRRLKRAGKWSLEFIDYIIIIRVGTVFIMFPVVLLGQQQLFNDHHRHNWPSSFVDQSQWIYSPSDKKGEGEFKDRDGVGWLNGVLVMYLISPEEIIGGVGARNGPWQIWMNNCNWPHCVSNCGD